EGLIGQVTSVSNLTSTVQLISNFDQLNRISAYVPRSKGDNVFGLVEGYDRSRGMLIFRIIDESGAKVKEEEIVVTSSLGGHFPSGLMIGTIKEITPDQYGLTKIAYVEPAANLNDIQEVIVVNRKLDVIKDVEEPAVEEDPEANEEEMLIKPEGETGSRGMRSFPSFSFSCWLLKVSPLSCFRRRSSFPMFISYHNGC